MMQGGSNLLAFLCLDDGPRSFIGDVSTLDFSSTLSSKKTQKSAGAHVELIKYSVGCI